MNSKIIKFVAGAGKTTYSIEYMRQHSNGLYLAFNNKVVNDISSQGLLSKTIDSLFQSFLFPKLIGIIPLIGEGKQISFFSDDNLQSYEKGVLNIHIDINGDIYNRSKKTIISLNTPHKILYSMGKFPNDFFIKRIFAFETLYVTNQIRTDLANYLIKVYPNKIIDILNSRFSFIIVDEAQDLKNYQEKFVELLYESNINLLVLGDDMQNINGGGQWFQNLEADETKNKSWRCPENNCEWIRKYLGIEIFGNSNESIFKMINRNDIVNYDDGNRCLLYDKESGNEKQIIIDWKGPKSTIKSAKGSTINNDIVIFPKSLKKNSYYTAITRTTKNVYTTEIDIK